MTVKNSRRGFTMVELLVVIGMLLLLIGSVSSSVSAAHRRAKVQQATAVAQEMTNAILAYENFGLAKGAEYQSPLSSHLMERAEAMEGAMGFILGQEARKDGEKGNIPVLFNANISGGAIRDPWGNPYLVTVRRGSVNVDQTGGSRRYPTAVSFPNFNRIPADEVQ